MKRLEAIGVLLGYAETVGGEFGGYDDIEQCREHAAAALKRLGVSRAQIDAARRWAVVTRDRHWRLQREAAAAAAPEPR